MSDLKQLFWKLDKPCLKWSTYFPIYEKHLSKFVGKSPKILEIGILGGGSLELWSKYFGGGTTVVGVDCSADCLSYKYDGNVTVVIGDQASTEFWKNFKEQYGEFDIIIDDGGHTMVQQITTLDCMYPMLKNNGVFVVEDTHTSYWQQWGGSFRGANTFVEYSKRIMDVVNNEFIRDSAIENSIKEIFRDLNCVSFYNSVVVFDKQLSPPFICLDNRNRENHSIDE
jgi:hypothetical protein